MRRHALEHGMTDGGDSPGDGGLFSRDLAPPPGQSRLRRMLVIGAVVLVGLGVWVWVHGSEGGALRAMSPAQREAFYQETWAAQRAKCRATHGQRVVEIEQNCAQHSLTPSSQRGQRSRPYAYSKGPVGNNTND
jgi:hypothetical protein